ncbi:TonB-dependent receptor [Aquimarina sp. 2201CG5-10]|uniref:SusC/RagA family TonB-linked outer membrane protein n=1 Tax=Aquimarina callyspongiae TaxID=3098150 RepID=UPI002AB388E0|nr:TonB-dependent receptor [Aquimarina sp. 2201CG5-10]MDY8137965.1 TonB-dependent receptor [Aquimarina sp. 2201CG5-10]
MNLKRKQNKYFSISKLLLLLCIMVVFGFSNKLDAQSNLISGKVIGNDGVPLPGVTITIKGNETKGTQTDFDGYYSIEVPNSETILIFRFLGFKTKEEIVGNQTTIDVILEEDSQSLGEVIVVGYGAQRKSDLTGAVSSVKGEDLNKFATTTAADGLQGNVAGLVVRRGTGNPRAGAAINIRGFRSIGGNAPLIIIDGIQGNFDLLNPNDIESIEVLKDGAAAAIYGSLSANGVILVTTKSGKDGKVKIEYNSFYGIDKINNKLDFANTSQYLEMARRIEAASPGTAPTYINENFTTDTDWIEELFDSGSIINHNLTISGGTEKLNFLASAGLNEREGILIGESRKKQQLRVKVNGTKGRLSLGANIYYVQTDDKIFGSNLNNAYQLMPIIPVRDSSKPSGFGFISDDDFNGVPDHTNPIGEDFYNDNTGREQNLVTNFTATLDVVKGLKITGRAGIENATGGPLANAGSPYQRVRPHRVSNKREVRFHYLEEYVTKYQQKNYEGFANYDNVFGKHTIGLLAGASSQETSFNWIGASVEGKEILEDGTEVPTGFLDPDFNTLDAGGGGVRNSYGSGWETARQSVYGRVNYSYEDRYFLQSTVRRDGSSRFGAENRYGVFPSVAAGWKISSEDFFHSDFINFLKLRASWGKLGSESNLGAYDYTVNSVSGFRYPFGTGEQQSIGVSFRDFPNPELKWETTININAGIDFGFLNNQLTGAINYYQRNTEDMIIPAVPPNSSGVNPINVNGGDVENKGIEIELNYRKSSGEFQYNLGLVLSHNKNELTKTNKDTDTYVGSATTLDGSPANITRLGHPIGAFFLYQADGIFQSQAEVDAHNVNGNPIQPLAEPGDIRFRDVNGDGQLNDDDLVFSGSGIPKVTLGLNMSGTYKGFDAFVQFYGAFGQKGYNTIRQNYEANDNYRNYLVSGLNTWTPTNTNTDIPRAVLGDPNQNSSRNSTRFLENASYLRIRNIQLGYTLPTSVTDKINIGKVRMYLSLQNVATITDYSGIDPEIGGTLNSGTDFVSYPNIKTSLLGFEVNF